MTATGVTKVRIEIGNNAAIADKHTAIYDLTPEQYAIYTAADNAFNKARIARDKALGEPTRYPVGICNFWITNVRLTKDGNQYIPAGTLGDLNVIETTTDRKINLALFYPVTSKGFGEVRQPEFERLSDPKPVEEMTQAELNNDPFYRAGGGPLLTEKEAKRLDKKY